MVAKAWVLGGDTRAGALAWGLWHWLLELAGPLAWSGRVCGWGLWHWPLELAAPWLGPGVSVGGAASGHPVQVSRLYLFCLLTCLRVEG